MFDSDEFFVSLNELGLGLNISNRGSNIQIEMFKTDASQRTVVTVMGASIENALARAIYSLTQSKEQLNEVLGSDKLTLL